jgi:peptide/nickel transport system permease protein
MRRRLLLLVPTALGLTVLVFLLLDLVPGDPVEIMLGEAAMPADLAAMRRALGLDRPPLGRLLHFLWGLTRGDLGDSIAFRAPVTHVIATRLPATLELAAAALLTGLVLGVPAGIVAAVRRGGSIDRALRTISLLGICIPSLWLGPILILVFAMKLHWLPVSGRGSPAHLVLPALTLGVGMASLLVRLVRASMLETLRDAYVTSALARGATRSRAVLRHALPNALPPVVTVVGLQAGALLAGTVITETIFSWPGIGRLLVEAIQARDYPLVQGCVLVVGLVYVAVNGIADLVVLRLDPRSGHDG